MERDQKQNKVESARAAKHVETLTILIMKRSNASKKNPTPASVSNLSSPHERPRNERAFFFSTKARGP